jgi:hypothetical protein
MANNNNNNNNVIKTYSNCDELQTQQQIQSTAGCSTNVFQGYDVCEIVDDIRRRIRKENRKQRPSTQETIPLRLVLKFKFTDTYLYHPMYINPGCYSPVNTNSLPLLVKLVVTVIVTSRELYAKH